MVSHLHCKSPEFESQNGHDSMMQFSGIVSLTIPTIFIDIHDVEAVSGNFSAPDFENSPSTWPSTRCRILVDDWYDCFIP